MDSRHLTHIELRTGDAINMQCCVQDKLLPRVLLVEKDIMIESARKRRYLYML